MWFTHQNIILAVFCLRVRQRYGQGWCLLQPLFQASSQTALVFWFLPVLHQSYQHGQIRAHPHDLHSIFTTSLKTFSSNMTNLIPRYRESEHQQQSYSRHDSTPNNADKTGIDAKIDVICVLLWEHHKVHFHTLRYLWHYQAKLSCGTTITYAVSTSLGTQIYLMFMLILELVFLWFANVLILCFNEHDILRICFPRNFILCLSYA